MNTVRDDDDPEQMTLSELITKRDLLKNEIQKHDSSLSVLRAFIKSASFEMNKLKERKNKTKSDVKEWCTKFEEKHGKEPTPIDKQELEPARLFEEYTNARNALESTIQQRQEAVMLEQKTLVMTVNKRELLEHIESVIKRLQTS